MLFFHASQFVLEGGRKRPPAGRSVKRADLFRLPSGGGKQVEFA